MASASPCGCAATNASRQSNEPREGRFLSRLVVFCSLYYLYTDLLSICADSVYINNVPYAELFNFFYVWLKRVLGDSLGLEHLFREELAETNREVS